MARIIIRRQKSRVTTAATAADMTTQRANKTDMIKKNRTNISAKNSNSKCPPPHTHTHTHPTPCISQDLQDKCKSIQSTAKQSTHEENDLAGTGAGAATESER